MHTYIIAGRTNVGAAGYTGVVTLRDVLLTMRTGERGIHLDTCSTTTCILLLALLFLYSKYALLAFSPVSPVHLLQHWSLSSRAYPMLTILSSSNIRTICTFPSKAGMFLHDMTFCSRSTDETVQFSGWTNIASEHRDLQSN
jgi:hypothetical protein